MTIEEAFEGLALLERAGAQTEITGVQYDSRRVLPGDVFVAMQGGSVDGNRYIADALKRGAAAIVTDSRDAWDTRPEGVPFALAEHGRRALAEVSRNVFGHPERKLKISAVTGTNGKTTTAWLLEQMLRAAGRTCVLVGTIETHVGDEVRVSEHTTPESRDLYALLADGVRAGATEVIMEMSSHALEQERVWGLPVDVAIFTNLTQDHLDYHGTMDAYAAAKAKMFAGVGAGAPRVAAINLDDAFGRQLASGFTSAELMSYGIEIEGCMFRAERISFALDGTTFTLRSPSGSFEVRSPLTGRVNVYNLLAACCAAYARGLPVARVVAIIPKLRQVPGRFEIVPGHAGLTVVVDYAHTDDALRKLIQTAREMVQPHAGRVITVFGCGGDRDRTKRPKMGRVAGEGSDLVVLTSDNPRSENPEDILAEVFAGVRETATECHVIADRREAISSAIRQARRGDIVLIAGKGHEKVQILREGTVPFDDVAIAAAILKELQ